MCSQNNYLLITLCGISSLLVSCATHTPSTSASSSTSKGVSKAGGAYYQDDGPGSNPPADLASIPDAVPYPVVPIKGGPNRPYTVMDKNYVPLASAQGFRQTGLASWYGTKYHGRKTSSGEVYDMYAMTAAHPILPIPSFVRVTHLGNHRSVIVKVNDRGPFHSDRIIDLSYTAAWKLGMVSQGSGMVQVEVVTGDGTVPPPPSLPVVPGGVLPPSANVPNIPNVSVRPNTAGTRLPASSPALGGRVQQYAGYYYVDIAPLADLASADRLRAQMYLEWSTLPTIDIIADKASFSIRMGAWDSLEQANQALEKIKVSINSWGKK